MEEKQTEKVYNSPTLPLDFPLYGICRIASSSLGEAEADYQSIFVVGGGGGKGKTGIGNGIAVLGVNKLGHVSHTADFDTKDCIVRSLSAHPKESRIVAGAGNSCHIFEIPIVADEKIKELGELHSNDDDIVRVVRYSPNGSIIAVAYEDGKVRIFDCKSYAEKSVLEGHSAEVMDLDFHPNSSLLATVASDKTARLWNVHNAECTQTINSAMSRGKPMGTRSIRFGPTGLDLFILQCLPREKALVTKWCEPAEYCVGSDTESDSGVDSLDWIENGSFRIGRRPQTCMAVSPNGEYIGTGDSEGITTVVNADNGAHICSNPVHQFFVSSVSFSNDSRHLLSTSGDYSVHALHVHGRWNRVMMMTISVMIVLFAFLANMYL